MFSLLTWSQVHKYIDKKYTYSSMVVKSEKASVKNLQLIYYHHWILICASLYKYRNQVGIIAVVVVETFFIVRIILINRNMYYVMLNWTYLFNYLSFSKEGSKHEKRDRSNCCYKYLFETLNPSLPYKSPISYPINLATMRFWPLRKRTINKIINIFVFAFGHRVFFFICASYYVWLLLFTYDWNFSGAYTIYTTFFSIYFCSLPHSCSVIAIQFTAQPNSRLKRELHKNYL